MEEVLVWGKGPRACPSPRQQARLGDKGLCSCGKGGVSPSATPCPFLLVLLWVWGAFPGTAFCPLLPWGTYPPCGSVGGGTAPCHCQVSEAPSHPCHGNPHVPHSLCPGPPRCQGLGEGLLNLSFTSPWDQATCSPPPAIPTQRQGQLSPTPSLPWGHVGGNGQLGRGGQAMARGVPSPPAWPSSPAASQYDSLSWRCPRSEVLNWFG